MSPGFSGNSGFSAWLWGKGRKTGNFRHPAHFLGSSSRTGALPESLSHRNSHSESGLIAFVPGVIREPGVNGSRMDHKEPPGEASSREWGRKIRDITHGYLLENRRVKIPPPGKVGMLLDGEGLEQGAPAGPRGLSQEMGFRWNFPSIPNTQIPKSQALPPPYPTVFPLFPSPGLSFYTRVLENCEDEAKFDEVGEVFHPFHPINPFCFPRIPSPGEIPIPNFCCRPRCLLQGFFLAGPKWDSWLDTGGKIPTVFSEGGMN